MALLHAVGAAASSSNVEVWALHVHHGLLPQADAWWAHVERQSQLMWRRGWPVRFAGQRLTGSPEPGQSVEAWARHGRYQALAGMAQRHGISMVLLAHHRRDQAETVLLQALRSGGPAGLSAMPHMAERHGITWVRPWLEHPREAIEAYVRRYRVRYVDDPSNDEPYLARNRLRTRAWKALSDAFPHAEMALAGTAQRMQEAAACSAELAAMDMAVCVTDHGAIDIDGWAQLSAARQANLLRHWAASFLPRGVPETLVSRLRSEAQAARNGAWWPVPGGRLKRERGLLVFMSEPGLPLQP